MEYQRRALVAGALVASFANALPASARAEGSSIEADRFDPWVEVSRSAIENNVRAVSKLCDGRPILAVVKNNGYGLGLTLVAKALDELPQVSGLAVISAAEAHELRDAGVRKPILLLSEFAPGDGPDLVRQDIQLSFCADDAGLRIIQAGKSADKRPTAQFYLDTGLGRMGIPYHRAQDVIKKSRTSDLKITGTLTCFAESDHDYKQLSRFVDIARSAHDAGIDLGTLHAASSHGLFFRPETHLGQVRTGLALFGAYPADAMKRHEEVQLQTAFRLRARVVRVERLRVGDSVNYGRRYVADKPTWIALLPVGHANGYPREAVNGGRVLLNGNTYPVIGAVSASHTIVEVGDERSVEVGDLATLVGPDHQDIHPNVIASTISRSVYDIHMHLSARLPRVVI
ncbi:MAG: alanine racemase [Gammaproteobacteria bacterium]|nr:alanine racemase [Gammaproteobacteria bacterium]MYL02209.1 alanine racemase [Gammaproteobacteria bacterium]